MSDLLSRISAGAVERPHSLIVFGPPGVGKSTFAASAPEPLFLDVDDRTAHLDVKRLKVLSWEDILEAFRLVARGELPCKTLVLDTLDHAELLLHKHICEQQGVPTIEDVGKGYGKGLVVALGEWRRLATGMEAIRTRGVNLVLLAHAHVKLFKNPTGEDYERIELKLDKRAHNFLRERVDAVGYAGHDTVIVKDKADKAKAKATGKTTLSFKPSAAVETKRFAKYPETCALSWEALVAGPT